MEEKDDSSSGADSTSEADTGDRKASASLENLITLYASFPLNVGDLYGKVGYHMVDVTTSETLPNASYGDDDITGFQVALGKSFDKTKLEIFYSDFEEVSLTATGGSGSHKIEADADVLGLKLSMNNLDIKKQFLQNGWAKLPKFLKKDEVKKNKSRNKSNSKKKIKKY